jgi:hypothetical protein
MPCSTMWICWQNNGDAPRKLNRVDPLAWTTDVLTKLEAPIIGILKEHEAGTKTADLCRKHGISDATSTTGRPSREGLRSPRRSG